MKGIKILIVEDDRFLFKLYSDKLQREGFEVFGSLTGEEAISKAPIIKPDLIILDIILPGKNGFEVLSDLKLNPETKKIPVVILTNLGQDVDMQKGLDLGAATYLVKTDFLVNQLAVTVKEYLAKTKKTKK